MNDKKQIEEMAKVIAVNCGECDTCEYLGKSTENIDCIDFLSAQELYNAGYRKINKDSVVLSREELNTIQSNFFDSGIKYGSKETAREIYRKADEICTGSQYDGDKILAMINAHYGVEVGK